MDIVLQRTTSTAESTSGLLAIDGVQKFFTLEPSMDSGELVRPGTYHVIKQWSPRFQMLTPHLQDVPGRSLIEIHPGNDSGDSEGCILLGLTQAPDWVGQSRVAFSQFMSLTEDNFDITITEQSPSKEAA